MKTKCIIVDDEPLAIDVINSYLDRFENIEVISKCRNGVEAFEALKDKKLI